MKLYTYFRSSAAFRVRIALNLKSVNYEPAFVSLLKSEHKLPEYVAVNPQSAVPALQLDSGEVITQSLAIIEYLEEKFPQPPLFPHDAIMKAQARAIALAVGCEIHPLNNLRVLKYLTGEMGLPDEAKDKWYAHWTKEGLAAIEKILQKTAEKHAVGNTPTVADCFIVPQIFNAQRFKCPLDSYPTIMRVHDECMKLEAFQNAAPQNQMDAVA